MVIGIMQPYFFAYIGYFQLTSITDVFVIYDDVQYIKGGYINRNRIAVDGKIRWLTFPVLRDAHDRLINQRFYKDDRETRGHLLRLVQTAYRGAPRFGSVFPLIAEIMSFPNANVAAFNTHLIQRMAKHLGHRTSFVLSSELVKDNSLTGEERVIEICRQLGASRYVNPIGGRNLYRAERFSHYAMELAFLEPAVVRTASPAPLSIIDLIMNSSDETLEGALKDYRLIPG